MTEQDKAILRDIADQGLIPYVQAAIDRMDVEIADRAIRLVFLQAAHLMLTVRKMEKDCQDAGEMLDGMWDQYFDLDRGDRRSKGISTEYQDNIE